MNTLLLAQKKQLVILHHLYNSIKYLTQCDVFLLESREQKDLKLWFSKNINTSNYDRIILFLRLKKEIQQVSFIRTIPNLVILEHDAFQNYTNGKYKNKFSQHYKKLPWARILTSGYQVSKKLKKEGFDAVFVPKGYDETIVANLNQPRTIELGFVGSIKNSAYKERKKLLKQLAYQENLTICQTAPGKEYVRKLNTINFFISADVGMGEYMIKNFEAMACGCVLFSWNQGEEENKKLGFVDMENIVLYSSIEELLVKINYLRKYTYLANDIALKGQRHVEKNFTFNQIGSKIVSALNPPLRQKSIKYFLGIKKYYYLKTPERL